MGLNIYASLSYLIIILTLCVIKLHASSEVSCGDWYELLTYSIMPLIHTRMYRNLPYFMSLVTLLLFSSVQL